ncbi:translation initiation factor [Argonema galeatum]|uniref:translation initiation factor n=1 Tax=Argonema galeatum TaxID=2942762 RepID=UPI002011824B|nr:translation initiation factor [Argonema galeatum]MCL1469042.1 translation initiation factor [Argonema galeatum A003/A1]
MSSSKRKSSDLKTFTENRIVYSEFGNGDNSAALKRSVPDNSAALERAVPELPPNQQDLRVQASRKGRKGKTVTIITGFQSKPETLNALLKQLKTQCGTGGTVKDNTIEIQGDCGQRLVQVLIQQGYKAKICGG